MSPTYEVERDRFGVTFSGPLEVGACIEVVPAAEYERLRDAAELAVTAAMDLLPLVGSWNAGYRVSDRIDPHLIAAPEEWAEAAYHVACLHAALEGLPEPEVVALQGTREPKEAC